MLSTAVSRTKTSAVTICDIVRPPAAAEIAVNSTVSTSTEATFLLFAAAWRENRADTHMHAGKEVSVQEENIWSNAFFI